MNERERCVCIYVCVCVCMFSHLKIEDMSFIQGSYSFRLLVEWWLSGELIWDPLLWVYVQ